MSRMTGRRLSLKNQDYNQIRNDCLQKGQLFSDDLFEHDVKGATWLRPGEITENPRFFVGEADRFDVVQGATTNCWLVVAMANLTMDQKLFNHVVPKEQTFRESYAGVFRFNIWQCGKWVEVVVDDRLPTKEGKLMYMYSTKKNEFWSVLLEKAFAKLYGSYNELTAGWFCEGMVDLTGGMVERLDIAPTSNSIEKLESILRKSLEKSSFMCVYILDNPSNTEEIMSEGLVKGHAYSITKITNIKRSKNTLLVRLRNPWGRMEWEGAWSDSSPEWKSVSDKEKKEIGLVKENDGEFWMPISDFTRYFQYIDICHLGPENFHSDEKVKIGWEANYFKGEWIKGVNAGGICKETFHLNPQYRITLADTDDDDNDMCTLIIALMQKNKTRKIWHRINFTLFPLEEPESLSKKPLSKEYILKNFSRSFSSKLKAHREIVVHDTRQPGVYCIIPATKNPDEEGEFLLRVYSEKKVLIDESLGDQPESMLEENLRESVTQAEPRGKDIQRPIDRKLLQRSDEQVEKLFHKIAGDESEIGWEGLQFVLDYAMGKTSETDVTKVTDDSMFSYFRQMISWVTNTFLFGRGNELSKLRTTFTKDECRQLITMLDDDSSGKLGFKEFRVLWKKMRQWESVFLVHSKEEGFMNITELNHALDSAGYKVNSSNLGRFRRLYCDMNDNLAFDDFVMCAIEHGHNITPRN